MRAVSEQLLAAAGILCTSLLANCTQIIQFTATELRKQLQNSARYEIRVSISQPPIFCFHFSAPYHLPRPFFMFPFHNAPFPALPLHFVSGPLRFQFSSRSSAVICLQSEQSFFLFVARISVTRSFAQPCTALHNRAQYYCTIFINP